MNHHFDLYNKHYSMLDSFISAILRQIDNTFNQSVCCGQFRNHFAETMWGKKPFSSSRLTFGVSTEPDKGIADVHQEGVGISACSNRHFLCANYNLIQDINGNMNILKHTELD